MAERTDISFSVLLFVDFKIQMRIA